MQEANSGYHSCYAHISTYIIGIMYKMLLLHHIDTRKIRVFLLLVQKNMYNVIIDDVAHVWDFFILHLALVPLYYRFFQWRQNIQILWQVQRCTLFEEFRLYAVMAMFSLQYIVRCIEFPMEHFSQNEANGKVYKTNKLLADAQKVGKISE